MEQICLVEAGNFFVGIHSDCIDSVIQREQYSQHQKKLLHLESFFCQGKSDDYPQVGVILHMATKSGLPDLLVDRLVVEIDFPGRFETLPKLYPALSGQCCPQIFIYDNQPVLLLDIDGFISCLEQLGHDGVLVELDASSCDNAQEKPKHSSGSARKEIDQQILEKGELLNHTVTCDSREEAGGDPPKIEKKDVITQEDREKSRVLLEDSAKDTPVRSPFDGVVQPEEDQEDTAEVEPGKEENKKLRDELTEGEFARVVCWTIHTFLQWDSPAALLLNKTDVPENIVHGVQGEVLDEVIAKTLVKCRTSSPEVLEAIIDGLQEQSATG